MSRSARTLGAAALILPALVGAAVAAPGPPTQIAPVAIRDAPLALNLRALPIDRPVSSLDNSVSFHTAGVVLQADVLFASGSAKLTPAGRARIAEAVANIRKRRPRALRIQGYTDSIGSVAYNLRLSRRRARAVVRALRRQLGAGAPRMRAIGYGEADPVAANSVNGKDNPAGRALNRRVEIRYVA